MAGPYVTTTGRRLVSIPVGAALGGAFSAAYVFVTSDSAMLYPAELGGPAGFAAMGFAQRSLAWLFGIVAIGFPLWCFLERRGRVGGWRSAAVFGCVASLPLHFVAMVLALILVSVTVNVPFQWSTVFNVSGLMEGVFTALVGGVVGLAMWRVDYRRATKPDLVKAFD